MFSLVFMLARADLRGCASKRSVGRVAEGGESREAVTATLVWLSRGTGLKIGIGRDQSSSGLPVVAAADSGTSLLSALTGRCNEDVCIGGFGGTSPDSVPFENLAPAHGSASGECNGSSLDDPAHVSRSVVRSLATALTSSV